jgi:sec-independent protein translocase protein TatB
MFGIDSGELLIIAVVALVVIGPKDLPRVMRTIGQFVGRARGMAKHFRTGVDAMIRESELEDMEKKWKADNERIMREHPGPGDAPEAGEDWPEPVADEPPALAPRQRTSKGPKAPPPRGKAPPRRAAPPIPAPKPAPPAGETP